MVRFIALALAILAAQPGCTPRTIVRKNPSACDTGIRYYRPKPWLLVTPVEKVVEASKERTVFPGPDFVNIELQYLPDFSEEYSIDVRTGLGTNNTEIKLENGWNLVSIGQELDSNFDENVEAIASLAETAGKIAASGVDRFDGGRGKAHFMCPASNVPIGYYESVIGCDPAGRKQLYGWRYIGFAPMQPCPVIASGGQWHDCETEPLYGLVFRSGRMMFVPLHEAILPIDCPPADSGVADEPPIRRSSETGEAGNEVMVSTEAIKDFLAGQLPPRLNILSIETQFSDQEQRLIVATDQAVYLPDRAREDIEYRLEEEFEWRNVVLEFTTRLDPNDR